MDFLYSLITNYALVAAFSGWFIAQLLKVFTGIFKMKKFTLAELFFGTGGMPSAHTSAVCALVCSAGVQYGVGSFQFAFAAVLAMIVIRDAMGMRLEVGKHAKALNMILKEQSQSKKDNNSTQNALKELTGHTPLQVLAGVIVGVAVALLLTLIPVFPSL